MNKNDQHFLAQKIRTQYMEKEHSELDELRELDANVKTPVNLFSYIFGSISAIIMGMGMSLTMTDIASIIGLDTNSMVLGIIIGIIGLVLAISNYPIHKALMNARRAKYADEIIALSDKIINE